MAVDEVPRQFWLHLYQIRTSGCHVAPKLVPPLCHIRIQCLARKQSGRSRHYQAFYLRYFPSSCPQLPYPQRHLGIDSEFQEPFEIGQHGPVELLLISISQDFDQNALSETPSSYLAQACPLETEFETHPIQKKICRHGGPLQVWPHRDIPNPASASPRLLHGGVRVGTYHVVMRRPAIVLYLNIL